MLSTGLYDDGYKLGGTRGVADRSIGNMLKTFNIINDNKHIYDLLNKHDNILLNKIAMYLHNLIVQNNSWILQHK